MSPSRSTSTTAGNNTPAIPTSVRVLELFFAIFESREGLRQEHIRELIPYRGYETDHFRITLHRDLEQLRDMGVDYNEHLDRHGRMVYQIDSDTVRSGKDLNLDSQVLTLIHMALQSVDTEYTDAHSIIDFTVRATVDDQVTVPARSLKPLVSSVSGVSTILSAISHQIPISFDYTSETESDTRTIEPWRLLVRGHAMYVWGYDLDRQAPRVFRLSRIASQISEVGEPGDCDHEMPQEFDPFADFTVAPTLLVPQGSDLPFAAELQTLPGQAPSGWRLQQGNAAPPYVWRERIIANASQCIVVQPLSLRHDILQRLSKTERLCASAASDIQRQGNENA